MKFTIALAQTLHPENGDAVALVSRFARGARTAGADIIVFPESLMSRYENDKDAIARMRQAIPVLDHLRDDVY